jgi:hypothetical protein
MRELIANQRISLIDVFTRRMIHFFSKSRLSRPFESSRNKEYHTVYVLKEPHINTCVSQLYVIGKPPDIRHMLCIDEGLNWRQFEVGGDLHFTLTSTENIRYRTFLSKQTIGRLSSDHINFSFNEFARSTIFRTRPTIQLS